MERAISGFHRDEEADWVAELSCGHDQHVRHRPPFQLRPWVLDREGRDAALGTPLGCPLCDRAEPPAGLRRVSSSPEWDELTVPAGLLRAHRVPPNRWGLLEVRSGRLQFIASTRPALEVTLGPESTQVIPPDIAHRVALLGPVRFSVGFFAVDRPPGPGPQSSGHRHNENGDPACWSGLICDGCGAMVDGGRHREGCGEIGS